MLPSYTKKTLQNGLRIILVPIRDIETVTFMILSETGSEYEKKDQNGISHFLEHMSFKGTLKRPTSKIINEELDGLGAQSNAFTSNDHTGFYAKAHSSKTTQIIDIISDIYLNSIFPAEEIEKEKGVVIEEINMYEDRPQSKVWDILGDAVFGNQPAGRTVLGTKDTVSAITRDMLDEYHKTHYVPEATVIVIAGRFDENTIIPQIENLFGNIPNQNKSIRPTVLDSQDKPLVRISHKESDQVHIVMAFRTGINSSMDEEVYKAGLLGSILGSGMSSRLFHRIREELGLAYYIHSSHHAELDYGLFTIAIGVSKNNVFKAIEAILEELKKIKVDQVGAEEIKRVKDMRTGHMYLSLETSNEWADFYGYQELYHEKILSPEEINKKREAVTIEDIQNLAQRIFVSEGLTISAVGDLKEVDSENILSQLQKIIPTNN